MGKRKLNDKQRERINAAQLQHQTSDHNIGLVLCSFGKKAEVEIKDGTIIICFIRPNLPTIVAGDNVVWRKLPETNTGIIESVLPRTTILIRHLKKSGINQPLAANVTQMIVVIAKTPEVDWCLLDTYLVTAEALNIHVVIVLNKIDLVADTIKACLEDNYKPLGYTLLYTTIHDESSANLQQLTDHISIMVGQSGVGKSSLIKKIVPTLTNQEITTLPLTNKSFGQHTTTAARFYRLNKNTGIIDSPGVRAFKPIDLTHDIILHGFRELRPFIGKCKFRNCNHIQDEGCAITHAVQYGYISKFRYKNLIKLLTQVAS